MIFYKEETETIELHNHQTWPLPDLQLTLGQEIRQEIRGTETPMGEGGQNVSEISNCIFVADKFLQKGTHT